MTPCCRFPFPGAWSIDSVRNGFATSTIKNDSDISSRSSLKRILRPGILVAPVERPLPSRTLAKVRQPCSVTRRVKDKQKSAHSLTPKGIEKNSVGKTKRSEILYFASGTKQPLQVCVDCLGTHRSMRWEFQLHHARSRCVPILLGIRHEF